jgi:hypothetical protein
MSALALIAATAFNSVPAFAQVSQTNPDAAYVPPAIPTNIAYELRAATAIPAVMVSGISGGQINEIEAQTTADVYDSETGQDLLIPQGSKLIGSVDPTSLRQGNYELVQWNQIALPTGLYLNIQSTADLMLKAAVDAQDTVEGRYVTVPTAAPFATVFFTPDDTPNAQIVIPAGVLFNVMLTKDIHINQQGSVVPPVLTQAVLPSAFGPQESVTPAAVNIPAPDPQPDPPTSPPGPTDPVVETAPVNITNVLDGGTAPATSTNLPPLKTAAVPSAGSVPSTVATDSAAPPHASDGIAGGAAATETPATPPAPPLAPPPPPEPVWYLNANDLIGTDLKNWGQQAGWTVIWQAKQDWPVPTSTHFQGDFKTVASQVLNDLAAQGADIRGKFFAGNQTLVITQPGASDDQ